MPQDETSRPLVEGIDYTIDSLGRYVFTRAYLLRRGDCCGSKCRNCPYGWKNVPGMKGKSGVSPQASRQRNPPA